MKDIIYTDDLATKQQELIEHIEFLESEEDINNVELDAAKKELEEINDIEDECADFHYGATLIHEDYFKTYIEELIADAYYEVYDLVNSYDWPVVTIDYEESAEQAKIDYIVVTYEGEDYYTR